MVLNNSDSFVVGTGCQVGKAPTHLLTNLRTGMFGQLVKHVEDSAVNKLSCIELC